MRVLILTASLLLLQLGISVEALACRGPFHSVQEIAESSAQIFTAVVTKRDAGNQGTEPVELRITSVLKGKPLSILLWMAGH